MKLLLILSSLLLNQALIAEALDFVCANTYEDSSLQKEPLWTEDYQINLHDHSDNLKKFSVSPDSVFYSSISNSGQSIAIVVWNNETRQSSAALYNANSDQLYLEMNLDKDKKLAVSCRKIEL